MKNKDNQKYFTLVLLVMGFIFLQSGYEKIASGKFVEGLAGTLGKFASNNPYPWFKDLISSVGVPNAGLFGPLVMYGEVLVGAALFGVSAYLLLGKKATKLVYLALLLGSLGAAALNGTFWLAAGWMSPSTESLNLLMFAVAVIAAVFSFNKWSKVGAK